MARWEANPRERLARAALDLFAERGYDKTTVADIVERAGLTKSTFFRHFEDKREVLFGGQDEMTGVVATSVASAPPGETPLGCVAALLCALGAYFPLEHRALAVARSAVIANTAELRERELLKSAHLMSAIEDALRSRVTDRLTSRLVAAIAIQAFELGYLRWAAATDARLFSDHVDQALIDLAQRATEFKLAGSFVLERPSVDQ